MTPSASDKPRRALVTGASGAIGAAICRRLARCGHQLYLHAHLGAERAESLATNHVIQRILRPISSAIASRS